MSDDFRFKLAIQQEALRKHQSVADALKYVEENPEGCPHVAAPKEDDPQARLWAAALNHVTRPPEE